MKAAYGTFLTALMVEYVHDMVADDAASEYNVTWTRTHPIAVSVGDDTGLGEDLNQGKQFNWRKI